MAGKRLRRPRLSALRNVLTSGQMKRVVHENRHRSRTLPSPCRQSVGAGSPLTLWESGCFFWESAVAVEGCALPLLSYDCTHASAEKFITAPDSTIFLQFRIGRTSSTKVSARIAILSSSTHLNPQLTTLCHAGASNTAGQSLLIRHIE